MGGTGGHCLVRRPGHLSRQAPLASVLAGGICPPSPTRPASPRPPRAPCPPRAWRVWSCPRGGLTSGGAWPQSVHKAASSGLSAGPGLPGPLWAAGHLSQVPSRVLFEEGPSVLPTPLAGAKNTRVVARPPPCLSERLAFQPRSHQILLVTPTRRWHTLTMYVFALSYICVIFP